MEGKKETGLSSGLCAKTKLLKTYGPITERG